MTASTWKDGAMPKRSGKQGPEDLNSLARRIVDAATDEEPDEAPKTDSSIVKVTAEKDPAAVALGRKGGLKGGAARAAAMTPEKRSEAAKKAAKARWGK